MKKIREILSSEGRDSWGNQAGFTLIELVMVIVILGILGAVAIPRFMDLSGDAIKSTAKGIEGALNATAAIQYAQNAIAGNAAYPDCATLDASTNASGIDLLCSGSNPYQLKATINGKPCTWDYSSTSGTTTWDSATCV